MVVSTPPPCTPLKRSIRGEHACVCIVYYWRNKIRIALSNIIIVHIGEIYILTVILRYRQTVIRHVLGADSLRGGTSIDLLESLSTEIARIAHDPGNLMSAAHQTAKTGNIQVLRLLLQVRMRRMRFTNIPILANR